MGQSAKALLQLFFILTLIATFIFWFLSPSYGLWTVLLKLGFPLLAVVSLGLLVRESLRKENLPDLLKEVNPSYFERNGFCFVFTPVVVDGRFWMNIYFQNRYSGACTSRIMLEPLDLHTDEPLGILAQIDCAGAAFGLCRIPWPISKSLQGLTVRFGIASQTKYPLGRGQLLRYREGLRVGASSNQHIALTGCLLAFGHLFVLRPARTKLVLPRHVSETAAPGDEATIEILWYPSDCTRESALIHEIRRDIL